MSEDKRLERLRFRSWHRGTREMDLLLGRFADAHLATFTPIQLGSYEVLLTQSDPDLYAWVTGKETAPQESNSDVLRLLRLHSFSQEKSTGPKLIIMCGLPGSGKTSYAKFFEIELGAIRFSPDEWMYAFDLDCYDEKRREKIEAFQWSFGQRLLKHGLTVIIEWGTWGKSERDKLRTEARELGAAVELYYLHAPADILFERIRRRGMECPPIERDQLLKWIEAFQAPTPDETALFDKFTELGP